MAAVYSKATPLTCPPIGAGLFSLCTGSYDVKNAFVEVDGAYTNEPPGGIACRCSFRVTEAVHAIERMTDVLAHKLAIDPARSACAPPSQACRTRYFFKTYGRQPLPESRLQESDLGHNTRWGAPETVAADIEAFVATGEPTADLPYADPSDVRRVRVEVGAARVLRREAPATCAASAAR